MVALRASIYLDWVPSKANIADLPSRGEFAALRAELRGIAGAEARSTRSSPPPSHRGAPRSPRGP
eukprot:7074763-Prymnesium_polylepis.1